MAENPFIITGYKSSEFFCDRKEETARILSAAKNNRNLTLFSLRGLGKTGLIHHAFEHFKRRKLFSTVYCDIYLAQNLNDFIKRFSSAVLLSLETNPEKFFKKAMEIFKGLRPAITADKITGEPSLELHIRETDAQFDSVSQIFSYLRKRSGERPVIIAIDEFQQIVNFPERNVEAILRMEIQASNDIRFIFSGSRKHLMLSIFKDYNRPFYNSAEMMGLEKIDRNEYAGFISAKFNRNKMKINREDTESIIDLTECHTYYVQYFCNKLFANSYKKISEKEIHNTLNQILLENESYYLEYKNLLPAQQWNLLTAIAKERGVKSVTSMSFVKKYNLTAPSSIKNSIDSLIEKDMIYRENEKYYVYDLFFSKWLERL
jgi:hypothetical protein